MLERTPEYIVWRQSLAKAHINLEEEKDRIRIEVIRDEIKNYMEVFKNIPKYLSKKAS